MATGENWQLTLHDKLWHDKLASVGNSCVEIPQLQIFEVKKKAKELVLIE